jgi:hypothetical protein
MHAPLLVDSFPKTPRTGYEASQFGGSHNYKIKQNKLPSFMYRCTFASFFLFSKHKPRKFVVYMKHDISMNIPARQEKGYLAHSLRVEGILCLIILGLLMRCKIHLTLKE